MTPKQIMEHGLEEGEDCLAIATIVRTAGTTENRDLRLAASKGCCKKRVRGHSP